MRFGDQGRLVEVAPADVPVCGGGKGRGLGQCRCDLRQIGEVCAAKHETDVGVGDQEAFEIDDKV